MLRLLRLLIPLVLIVVALAAVVRIALVPVAEHQAEDALGRAFGAPVDVTLDPPFRPSFLRGRVGDVEIHAVDVTRGGLTVHDVQARVVDAHVRPLQLARGTLRVRFSAIRMRGVVTQAALAQLVRARLAAASMPSVRTARVRLTAAGVTVFAPPGGRYRFRVVVPSADRVELVPLSAVPPQVADATRPILVEDLPYGIHVTGVRTQVGRLVLSGGRGAGTETFG